MSIENVSDRKVNQHGVNLDDVKVGATVTFQVTGVVKSNPSLSRYPDLGKFVNLQSSDGINHRIFYLSEATEVVPPPVKEPESGRVLVGGEVFELLPDTMAWESIKNHFYSWEELVDYARANNLSIFELEVGKQVQL